MSSHGLNGIVMSVVKSVVKTNMGNVTLAQLTKLPCCAGFYNALFGKKHGLLVKGSSFLCFESRLNHIYHHQKSKCKNGFSTYVLQHKWI